MRYLAIVLGTVAILATGGRAADTSASAEREYVDRVLTMNDSAASHVELAKWCEANGLSDRALVHWREALHRDPDCAAAKAALSGTGRNLRGESAASAAPAPAAAAAPAVPQDPTFAERRRELSKEIQDISIRYLGRQEPEMWNHGRTRILTMRDPAAAEPIARILGIGDEAVRKLACEALGQIPGDEAAKLLVKFVLSDQSDDVFKEAVASIERRTDHAAMPMLTNALNGSQKVMNRAAWALGEIRDLATAPALIAHLRRPETKTLKAPAGSAATSSGPSAYMMVGTITTYVADVQPVVAQAAVGWDPTIGAIPVGSCLVVGNPRVTIYRTIIEFVPQPAVRDALQKIAGQDCEYNPAAWRDAIEKTQRDQAKAAAATTP